MISENDLHAVRRDIQGKYLDGAAVKGRFSVPSLFGSFCTLFRRCVGISASAFQRRHRAASAPERQLPASLIPGCLSLMGGISDKEQFSIRQAIDETDRSEV